MQKKYTSYETAITATLNDQINPTILKHMELTRITVQPDICHGKSCIRGMRYPVSLILELLAAGMSHAEILADYPALEEADIRACLAYGARLSDISY